MSLNHAIAQARIQLNRAPRGCVVAISTPYLFHERHAYVALDIENDTMTLAFYTVDKFPGEWNAFRYCPALHTPFVPKISDVSSTDWFSLGLLRK